MRNGLLDELCLWVHPVLAGVGTTGDMIWGEDVYACLCAGGRQDPRVRRCHAHLPGRGLTDTVDPSDPDVWRFSGIGNKCVMLNVARSIWASVQGDPTFMRRLNGWLTIFWIVMIPVSIATGWVHSITYVSALSIWALVSGHWSTWQAARVEVTQQEEADKRERNRSRKRSSTRSSRPTSSLRAHSGRRSSGPTLDVTVKCCVLVGEGIWRVPD